MSGRRGNWQGEGKVFMGGNRGAVKENCRSGGGRAKQGGKGPQCSTYARGRRKGLGPRQFMQDKKNVSAGKKERGVRREGGDILLCGQRGTTTDREKGRTAPATSAKNF